MSYVDDEGPRNRSGPLCNLCSLLLCFFFGCFLVVLFAKQLQSCTKKQSECMETETFRGKKAREGKMIDSVTQAKCRILSSIRSIHHLFGPATAKFSTASGVQ